jgi:DNA-3-methyladenine glycosylase
VNFGDAKEFSIPQRPDHVRSPLERAALTKLAPPESARFFLGKCLCVTGADGGYVEALITETEAYGGAEDAACHGHLNRRTERTRIMFSEGGYAYVYLCYGLHRMLNVVTGPEGSPEAVLIRAVKIIRGQEIVQKRRPGVKEENWANGPGKVCSALDIHLTHYGHDLTLGSVLWFEDRGHVVEPMSVKVTPRIGIDYAGEEWSMKPWRFVWVKGAARTEH